MNFAAPHYLAGSALAVVYGLVLLFGALRARRMRARFGDLHRVDKLTTFDSSKRRAYKSVFLVLATVLAFVAAARPQYGKGQRLIPATNVDVAIVLDFSKSMYARDVEPSRVFRAKLEVARLVRELRGARFAAVAFAGDAIAFPLTADGSAIAQFFRRLEPNDMPTGGTAIGRALREARELFERDPKSKDHKRFIILITDGDDLEGSPVAVAREIGKEGTTIHVVQIGGRTPEPIPDVSDDGRILGYRIGNDGRPLTTELTAQGERQLEAIASATPAGKLIRAEKGGTGIAEVTSELRAQMKSEYAEKVETVYADVYMYPLGLALILMIFEAFLGEAPYRRFRPTAAPGPRKRGSAPAGAMPVTATQIASPWQAHAVRPYPSTGGDGHGG